MCISKLPFAIIAVITLLTGAQTSIANADGPSVYAKRCASCHGPDGRADTPVGRALGIRSFEGQRFSAEGVGKLLRDSKAHASVDASVIEGELEALVEALNAMAGGDDT